jgi:hypothetical protein
LAAGSAAVYVTTVQDGGTKPCWSAASEAFRKVARGSHGRAERAESPGACSASEAAKPRMRALISRVSCAWLEVSVATKFCRSLGRPPSGSLRPGGVGLERGLARPPRREEGVDDAPAVDRGVAAHGEQRVAVEDSGEHFPVGW